MYSLMQSLNLNNLQLSPAAQPGVIHNRVAFRCRKGMRTQGQVYVWEASYFLLLSEALSQLESPDIEYESIPFLFLHLPV